MKITYINSREDQSVKGVHNWQWLLKTPSGRQLGHFHVEAAATFPEAKKHLTRHLKNRNEAHVIAELV